MYFRRNALFMGGFRQRKITLFIIVLLIFTLYNLKFISEKISGLQDASKGSVELERYDVGSKTKDVLVESQKCKIPELQAFDPAIFPHLEKPVLQNCTQKYFAFVKKDVVRLKVKNVVSVVLYYIKRVNDFKNELEPKHLCGENVAFNKGKKLTFHLQPVNFNIK